MDRNRLQALMDPLPESDVQVAISLLAELGEQEIIDAETAAKLDLAAPAVIRPRGFPPAAVRDHGSMRPWQVSPRQATAL